MSQHDKSHRRQGDAQQEGFTDRHRQYGGQEAPRYQRGFGEPEPSHQRAGQDWQRGDDRDRDGSADGRGRDHLEALAPGRGPDDWYGSNNPDGLGRGSDPARTDDPHEMRPYPAGRLGARMISDLGNYRRDHDRSDQNNHSVFDQQGTRSWRDQDGDRGQRGHGADSHTRGFREAGYGGYDLARSDQDAFDPDYHQWRREQMDTLDSDYRAFRQERRQKFSDEFFSWRDARQGQRGQPTNDAVTTGTSSGPATDSRNAGAGSKADKDR